MNRIIESINERALQHESEIEKRTKDRQQVVASNCTALRLFTFHATHSLSILSTKVRCVLGWTAEGNAVVGLVAKRVQCISYTISG